MCEGLFQYFSNIYTNRANRLDKTTIRMVNTYHDVHYWSKVWQLESFGVS